MADPAGRRRAFVQFLIFGLLSTGSVYAYVAWRFIAPAGLSTAGAALAWVVVMGLYLLGPLAIVVRRRPAERDWRSRLLGTFYWVGGVFLVTLPFVVLRDLAWLFVVIADAAGLVDAGVATGFTAPWIATSNAVLSVLIVAAVAHGHYSARRTPRLRRVDVPIPDLAAELEGFTIAQITDVHVGPFTRADFVARVCERIEGAAPDIVAVTGDLVDGPLLEVRAEVEPLAELAARRPVYYVTGNHEYYAGADLWCQALAELGLEVLHNRHVVVRRGGAELVVGGVPDVSGHRFVEGDAVDIAATFAGAPAGAPRVLLAHQPRTVALRGGERVDLQLSGHTHGGQVFPFHFTIPLQQPVRAGLAHIDGGWVYVSRGTGFWGPPLRVLAPSEITLLRLHRLPPVQTHG